MLALRRLRRAGGRGGEQQAGVAAFSFTAMDAGEHDEGELEGVSVGGGGEGQEEVQESQLATIDPFVIEEALGMLCRRDFAKY